MRISFRRWLTCFAQDERGVISVWSLFLVIASCCIGAAAVDVTHFYAAQSQLQVAADVGAHSALYTRRYGGTYSGEVYYPLDDEGAKEAAIAAVEYGMPKEAYGIVLDADQIVLGHLNYETGHVEPNTVEPIDAPDSAAVTTDRAADNPVASLLFRIVGVRSMDVATSAVFSLGPGECMMDQGFFAQNEVRIRGGNTFHPGFCVGTPTFIVQNQNEYRPGVATVIPNRAGLDVSSNDMDKHNPGLRQSLQYDQYPAMQGFLDSELDLVQITTSSTTPDYNSHPHAYSLLGDSDWSHLSSFRNIATTPINASDFRNVLTPSQLTSGKVYSITCSGRGRDRDITMKNNGGMDTFQNMVILTNCGVSFDGSVKLEDVVLSTSDTRAGGLASIHSPTSMTGLTIGKDDDCAPGGGAALITRSDFNMSAKVNFYGAHIQAGTVADFQSNAEGEGISLVAKQVNANSNITMRVCGPARDALPRNVTLRMIR